MEGNRNPGPAVWDNVLNPFQRYREAEELDENLTRFLGMTTPRLADLQTCRLADFYSNRANALTSS